MDIDKKIAILVGDGMADYPIEELGGKSPLEAAATPNMDFAAGEGILGMAKTVPEGMQPGSDTANLSLFGYDPERYYTGRAPLEAINMGLEMGPDDVAFRCNLVNISDDNIMSDFSAGHIETEFTKLVIEELKRGIASKNIELYPGVSYRNILIWRDYPHREITGTTPPHDIQGRQALKYLPAGGGADILRGFMELSREIIAGSDIIKKSKTTYRGNPTSAWLWGGGRKPSMDSLEKRLGLKGFTISAVDLIHGIGRAIGLSPLPVEGATGYIDTNYTGKAEALLEAMKTSNFVFLHVESPDESGHEGNLKHKLKAIEDFDRMVVGPVLKGMKAYKDYTILIIADHPTPVSLRTHTAEPVPFCIYSTAPFADFKRRGNDFTGYNERSARQTGIFIDKASRLLEIMINRKL